MTPDGDYHVQVPEPETPPPAGTPRPWMETDVVGRRLPRVDAYERVSGSALYPSDVVLPGMLYGAILRCPHAHATVERIDASAARSMPGVRAVISSETPEAQLSWSSQGAETWLFDRHCRHEGEAVAAVAAESPYQARDAIRAIEVEYAVLPFVVDERQALAKDAAPVHDEGNRVGETEIYERGDLQAGFAAADVVVERTFRTAAELHTPMELHGCVARWDGDHLTIWESTQGVYRVQQQVAGRLGLPLANVRVIGHYMGGGFGSKLVAGKYTVIAALLAQQTARPVKLFLSREETFLCVGNRPPSNMRIRAGVKRDGTLTALEFSVLGTGGAYPAGGTALVDWQVRDLYTCPNVRTEATDVYTHAGPARPFRAPGHPQGSWALEQTMDALAAAIDLDPVELRLRNTPARSQARDGEPRYTTTGLAECLKAGANVFGWHAARQRPKRALGREHVRRGVGVAACEWIAGGGGPPSTVLVKLFADGSVNLNMGASDIGTGTKTVMAAVVAEELHVEPDAIQIEHADTATTQYATPSGGSKTVPTEAPAARAAALDVKRQVLELAADELETPVSQLTLEDGEIVAGGDTTKRLRVAELAALRRRRVIVGVGYRGANPEGWVVSPFAAQFCEVEVNTKTGEIRILRFLGAHDSGRVMSRLTYDNQVFGGITMGIGFAMTEARILDQQTGKLANRSWHDYRIPTALDVPTDMTAVPLDLGDTVANSTGAKGLGEPVTIPAAAAIANAIYDATGIRVTEAPVTPARLLELIEAAGEEG